MTALSQWWRRRRYRRQVRQWRQDVDTAYGRWAATVARVDVDTWQNPPRRRAGYGRQWWGKS